MTVCVRAPEALKLGAVELLEILSDGAAVMADDVPVLLLETGTTSLSPTRIRSEESPLAALIARTDVSN